MKRNLLILITVSSLCSTLFAGSTLRLKIEPERDYLLSGSKAELVLKIDLVAAAVRGKHSRTPLNLAVALDRSGSMSGAKIEKARQAAMLVVDQLSPEDYFSMIIYSDHAEVLLPAQRVEDKERLKRQIGRISVAGSTALYAGVKAAAEQVEKHLSSHRINRVLLLSDGLANVGPSSPAELRRLGGALSERGIAVTTIGVGDDYNEVLMAGLAEASDANYYYVQDTEKLPQIFAKELGELLTVAARQVRIEIICPAGIRPIGLIGRQERFEGQRAVVRLEHFTPLQDRYLFLRCRAEQDSPEIATVNVTYIDELNQGAEETIKDVARIKFTGDPAQANQSSRPEVVAHKELFLTALAKDDALAEADAGRYRQAAEKLSNQAGVLEAQYGNASAPLRQQLRQEVDNLRLRSSQLQQNQYDSRMRKSIDNESWQYRNSK